MLTKDQIKRVAKLANLPITEEEEEKYTYQLSKILDYIDQLNKVNTSRIEPTYNVSGNTNVTRNDELSNSLTQDEALKNTPNKKNGFIVTKGVFKNE